LEQFYKILNALYDGELFVVPVLLILFLILKRRIKISGELLVSYNYFKLFLITISFMAVIVQLGYLYLQSRNDGEFTSSYYRISGSYSWGYWLLLVMSILLFIFLCFKRWRLSPWFAFAVFFFSTGGLSFERFVILITSLYRDYLPSSWSVSYNFTESLISALAFLTVLFLIYFFRKRFVNTKAEG
jgi:hypothetical protein